MVCGLHHFVKIIPHLNVFQYIHYIYIKSNINGIKCTILGTKGKQITYFTLIPKTVYLVPYVFTKLVVYVNMQLWI